LLKIETFDNSQSVEKIKDCSIGQSSLAEEVRSPNRVTPPCRIELVNSPGRWRTASFGRTRSNRMKR
jgi:hypothetical protein